MVTFVCYNCDQTLKKKQLVTHGYQCGQPTKYICIDCRKVFVGDEHKTHVNCMTEKEKYWGQYKNGVPGKKGPQNNKTQQNGATKPEAQQEPKPEKKVKFEDDVEEKKEESSQENGNSQENLEEKEEQSGFLGWKKEIRKVLKEQNKIKVSKLKKQLVKLYIKTNPQAKEKEVNDIFDSKLQNKKYSLTEEGKYVTFTKSLKN